MSTLDTRPQASDSRDCAAASAAPVTQRIAAREAQLGEGMRIYRALPTTARRTIGAWCFLDHFGPLDVSGGEGLRVGPHPHIGLQTVTWLRAGEILHRDSLGCVQPIRPGQLNLMTAGRGIAHSEESPRPRPALLHGAQLWIALPESARDTAPAFDHHPDLPTVTHDGLRVTVLAGKALGRESPARVYTPLVGLELCASGAVDTAVPAEPAFEYGALVLEGEAEIAGEILAPGTLLYLGRGRDALPIRTTGAAALIVIGGEPFAESALLWWNFVARTRPEISRATQDWNAGADYFGQVHGYDGARLAAPPPPWLR